MILLGKFSRVVVAPQEVDDAIERRDEQRCPDAASLHRHILTVEALLVSDMRGLFQRYLHIRRILAPFLGGGLRV